MIEKPNRREICFLSMKRSGHHAVIYWAIQQMAGDLFFVNDSSILHQWGFEKPVRDLYAYNVEDPNLRETVEAIKGNDRFLGPSGQMDYVLILRDPYNMIASRIEFGAGCQREHVDLWKEHAREYLNITRHLPDDKIVVSFNEWYKNPAYRGALSKKFGFAYCEDRYDKVTEEGGGSSFQRGETDATKLNLFDRWKTYQENPVYLELISDPELKTLSDRIFGKIYAV